MSDGTGTEHTETPETTAPRPATARRRRLAIWLGGGLATVVLLFVLVVFVLPTPVARYVIESQLEELGIQHGGIDTVDIDLWNSQVRAGPVAFRSGEAPDGQLGETGFDYSFGELFNGHAFVRTFYLRGVDVYVTRLEGGAIAINGINLQQLAPSEEEAAEAAPEEAEEGPGFGFGGDSFEFADSRLVFQDVSGGTLAMELDLMTLDRLRSWTPNEPTAFAFKGRLNEIELALDGTIVPLGDPIIATLNTRVKGVTLDRIAQFIGPTGLAKQDGSVDTEVHYNYSIYSNGRIEGTVDGTYHLSGFDIATAEGETVNLDEATLKVDLLQQLPGDGSATASGQLRLAGGRLTLGTAAGDALELGTLELVVDSLDLRKGTEPRERLREPTPLAGAIAETTPSIVELLIGWARDLAQDALNHRLSIDGEPIIALKDGLVRLAAPEGAPGREIRFHEAKVDLGNVFSEARDASVTASSPLDAALTGLRVAMQDGSAEASLADVRVASRAINFNATRAESALTFDLAIELQRLAAKDDKGAALDLGRLALTTENYKIAETADSEEAGGPVTVVLQELAASLPVPEGTLALRGEDLEVSLSPFTLTGKQGEAASFAGSVSANGLALERGGESPLSASLASTHTDLTDFRVAPLDASAEISGGLATSLSDIRIEAQQGTDAMSLALQSLDNKAEGLRLSGLDSDAPSIALSNLTSLSGLAARLESGERKETLTLSLDTLENRAEQLQYSGLVGSPGIALSNLTSLSGLAARLESGEGKGELTFSLDSLENRAEQLQASGLGGSALDIALSNHLRLNGLSASLPIDGEWRVEAAIAALDAPLSELALSGSAVKAKGAVEITDISAQSDGEAPQSLDLASLSVTGLDGDSENGAAIERIALGELTARLSLALPGRQGTEPVAGEVSPAGEVAEAAEAESGDSPAAPSFEYPFKLGEFSLAPGSRIEITDRSVEPPLQAKLLVEELRLGPIDTTAPETRTDVALALSANETSKVSLRGWAAPFKSKPDFELASEVERLPLPALSPYAAQATGVNVESGELSAGIAANASEAILAGKIDLRIVDLFVSPLTEEEAERIKADIGLPVGFAVSILKDSKGVIAFGLPLSGTVDAPEVDYSEAIDKAISGAMASVFPTNWFGPDGNTFEMQPAPFVPGTAELTKEGMEVADQMGGLFADKPGISIRACGRAGRADLVALRGDLPGLPSDTVTPAGAPAETAAGAAGAAAAAPAATPESEAPGATAALPPPSEKDIAAPNEAEVQALLALATERGLAVRKYLEARYGVDPGQVPECRTTYSIDDGKAPRAEFQF